MREKCVNRRWYWDIAGWRLDKLRVGVPAELVHRSNR